MTKRFQICAAIAVPFFVAAVMLLHEFSPAIFGSPAVTADTSASGFPGATGAKTVRDIMLSATPYEFISGRLHFMPCDTVIKGATRLCMRALPAGTSAEDIPAHVGSVYIYAEDDGSKRISVSMKAEFYFGLISEVEFHADGYIRAEFDSLKAAESWINSGRVIIH